MKPSQRLTALFMPAPRVRRILWFVGWGAGMTMLCFLVALALWPPRLEESGGSLLEFFLLVISMFALPGVTLLLIVAVLFEKRNPPRALLWGLACALIVGAGGLLAALMFVSRDLAWDTAAVFLLVIVGPIVLVISLPGIYFWARAVPEVRAAIHADAAERTIGMIDARGEVSLAELGALAGLPTAEMDDLVDTLLRTGRLQGVLDSAAKKVYSTRFIATKQRLILELVRQSGRVHLRDLERILQAPRPLLSDWIYQLVQRGQFEGAINWKEGWLYAAHARSIGADSRCPQCGGKLSPGSGRRIECLHCGSEIFWDETAQG
jgi:hypothetical protein